MSQPAVPESGVPEPGVPEPSAAESFPPESSAAAPELPVYLPVVSGTNGLAIATLVLGILGCVPFAPILAMVLGTIALTQLRSRIQSGRSLAVCGLCSAAMWTLFHIVMIGAWIAVERH